jgi:hypothetical protein
MKFIAQIIIIASLTAALQLIFTWWTAAVAAFIVALIIPQSGCRAFLAGLIAVGLLWFIYALFISLNNDGILAARVIGLFPLPHSAFLLILITGIIGGLVGGLGALTGNRLKYLIHKKNTIISD